MKNIFFLGLIWVGNFGIAQTLSSSLSTQKIDLGDPIQMKINISDLKGKKVTAAPKDGLLPFSFEEHKDDIEINDNQYIRTIDFTIYDEGKHQIPSLEFKVGDEILRTIPYEIEVVNPVQPNEQINDILPNEEVKLGVADYWEMYKTYFFGALVVLGLIGFGLLFWFNKKVKSLKNNGIQNPALKSLKRLENLENKNLIDKNEYRLFYIELTEISREYLVEQYHIPADVLLTEDLINYMKNTPHLSAEKIKVLEEILMRGDMVKFAKIIPEKTMMEADFHLIKNLIKNSHFNA